MKKIIGRKAEWLKGDGEAWINTGYKANPESVVNIRFKPYDISVSKSIYGARVRLSENSLVLGISASLGIFWSDRRHTDSTGNRCSLPLSSNIELENVNSPTSIVIGDSVFKINTQPSINTKNIFLFWLNGENPYDKFDGAIQYFKIDKLSLTPLVLTSSLPAYLSSDNLPHAAGECGMWDSVNEKFYGNANTSGAFSVENELDEYVEVDLTGIAINGKYQRVSVENSEIPQVVWNGVNAKMLMLNGKVVYKGNSLKSRYEMHKWLDFKGAYAEGTNYFGAVLSLASKIKENLSFNFIINEVFQAQYHIVLQIYNRQDFADGTGRAVRVNKSNIVLMNAGSKTNILYTYDKTEIGVEYNVKINYPLLSINMNAAQAFREEWYDLVLGNTTRAFNGQISTITTDSNTFTPCKLLTDADALVCADGMMHSAGECGMVDSKGIFYFNTSQYGYLDVSD